MDKFTEHYVVCALWSSTDDNGIPLDEYFDADDLAPDTLAQIVADCEDFQTANTELLADSGQSDEQNGHDFWLTRNRHGAGFWDRGLGEIGERLTTIAHAYGGCDLYVGDDDKLYI